MKLEDFLATLERRASAAGLVVPDERVERLGAYFQLLARWNQRMNLAGFSLDSPTDAAVDRLFIEPLVAARAIQGPVKAMIDVGSGGGSPAFPMALALSPDRIVLVEAKSRKAVFLREVARALGLADHLEVVNARFQDLASSSAFSEQFDLLSVRAVRVGTEDLSTMSALVSSGGRLILFRTTDEASVLETRELRLAGVVSLDTHSRSSAAIMEKVSP